QTWSYSADATADDGGGFSTQFQLPTSFVASYLVTATGASSGTVATTFTDSAANLDQCLNGPPTAPESCRNDTATNWGDGTATAQKSHYAEDEFIPYRATVTGITNGLHDLWIAYETVHGSKHALDYLGSFDATETTSAIPGTLHVNNSNPCIDVLPAAQC